MVSSIETGARKPQPEFARRCDEVLGTGGALERMLPLVTAATFPGWFRPWVDVEDEARMLRSWQPLVADGLLQTADYARALLRVGQPGAPDEKIEELVAARLERQKILDRDEPPVLWIVLDEGVLHRQAGSPTVMREQLAHLIEAAQCPHVTIQVVPMSAGVHSGHLGAFAIASLNGEADVVYLESARAGQVSDRPEDVQEMTNIWEAIRAEALPARASLDLLTKVMEQWT